MTREDFLLLTQEDIRKSISDNIDKDPALLALSLKNNPSLIATQVKYLQRARTKLPSFYAARCIIPPLAFEQCSSEQSAGTKHYSGNICIDLTCGLGIDTINFSKHFKRVISIEQNEILADIVRYNLKLLGIKNVTVICGNAEDFIRNILKQKKDGNTSISRLLQEYINTLDLNSDLNSDLESGLDYDSGLSSVPIDLIYTDPARRSTTNAKLVLLEDCSPNILALAPLIKELTNKMVIKASPLFDVDEAFRLFDNQEDICVEAVSYKGECKEVVIEVNFRKDTCNEINTDITNNSTYNSYRKKLKATIAEEHSQKTIEFGLKLSETDIKLSETGTTHKNVEFNASYRYLLIPDVSFYKLRTSRRYILDVGGYSWSDNGYGFSNTEPNDFMGHFFEIEEIIPFKPKQLKQTLRNKNIKKITILKRDFTLSSEDIMKRLGATHGEDAWIAFTCIERKAYAILLRTPYNRDK